MRPTSPHHSHPEVLGQHHICDQRQARRYSDKGIEQLVRHISSEWVLEASPSLSMEVVKADDEELDAGHLG